MGTMSDLTLVITLSLASTLIAYTSAACLGTRCRLIYATGALAYIALIPLWHYSKESLLFVIVLWVLGIPAIAATLVQIRRVRHSCFPRWYRAWSVAYPSFLSLLLLTSWGYHLVGGVILQVSIVWIVLFVLNLTFWGRAYSQALLVRCPCGDSF